MLYTTTAYPLSSLVTDISIGKIGLPELQRPFVWPKANVRDLFDSLYKGYPVGFLLLWETGAAGLRSIGTDNKQVTPSLAIVDGQQRLTSLFAVMTGTEVIRADFKREVIRIAFDPLAERFEVANAATAKDKAFIPDIAELWKPPVNAVAFAMNFLAKLGAVRELAAEETAKIQTSIGKLSALSTYSFNALTINSAANAEIVADIFVRVNGQGKKLNQSDFILTLMSVFWDEGRGELETFARNAAKPGEGAKSPYNHFIRPSPDQLLRAAVAVGLKRAKLENVYRLLRGKDAVTGLDDATKREEQFARLKAAQAVVLNLANWHHFLGALTLAGYRSGRMISSETAIVYSYALYLIGISDLDAPKPAMRQAIAEFFFMAALTGRYTSSSETRFDADLNLLRNAVDANDYIARLRAISGSVLTEDYWKIRLPEQLATSGFISPSRFAYQAALIKLGARTLYGPMKVAEMADPAIQGSKAAFEQHHLFPRAYLLGIGIDDQKQINQIANFAPVEWPENIAIGAKAPSDYVPQLEAKMSPEERDKMRFWHALPVEWWCLSYDEFLKSRRLRIANVVRSSWEQLCDGEPPSAASQPSVADLIAGGETGGIEFKSTLRTNLHTGQHDEKIQMSALKTIAGFLNAGGGTLLIGVSDDGNVVGITADGFANEDKMSLHLVDLIRTRLGPLFLPYIHPEFEDEEGGRVLLVRCEKGPKPAFVKDGQLQRFFVRAGNSTAELHGLTITEYVKSRFD